MESHTLNYNNTLLEFNIARSKKRRRTIAIHVSKKGIEVKVPYATQLKPIIELVQERFDWIQGQLMKFSAVKEHVATPWYSLGCLFYLGESYAVHVETFPFAKKKGECVLNERGLVLTIAQKLTTLERTNIIKKTLEAWYREKAEGVLRERTEYFAQLMQVKPKEIMIKTQKSRWGSCDRHNNIRYNWKIIMAAPELLDYLVVHELAHIRVKNHSKKFWDVVAQILPDHKARRKALHEFGRGLLP